MVFVETERARFRPPEEYFCILRAADDAIAKVSAKNTSGGEAVRVLRRHDEGRRAMPDGLLGGGARHVASVGLEVPAELLLRACLELTRAFTGHTKAPADFCQR